MFFILLFFLSNLILFFFNLLFSLGGGLSNEMPGTDHVISGPRKKLHPMGQTHKHRDRRASLLYDYSVKTGVICMIMMLINSFTLPTAIQALKISTLDH